MADAPHSVVADAVSDTLPFEFDTRGGMRLVLKGMFAMSAFLAAAAVFVLLARHAWTSAGGLLLLAGMLAAFGRVFLRHVPGAEGRITHEAVIVRRTRVWGLAVAGPVGTFPLRDFTGVRSERVSASAVRSNPSHPHEWVTLVGRTGTPDVLVLQVPWRRDVAAGQTLADLLDLPLLAPTRTG